MPERHDPNAPADPVAVAARVASLRERFGDTLACACYLFRYGRHDGIDGAAMDLLRAEFYATCTAAEGEVWMCFAQSAEHWYTNSFGASRDTLAGVLAAKHARHASTDGRSLAMAVAA